jgi:hypothetical protein
MERERITRRSLLTGAGKIAVIGAGIAAVSGGLDLFSIAEAKGGPTEKMAVAVQEIGPRENGRDSL